MPEAGLLSPAAAMQPSGHRGRSDLLLRQIAEGTAAAVGDDFFPCLTRNLAAALNVRYAFVAELTEPNRRVRTLAFWTGESFAPNFEYDLEGTPCQQVLQGEVCHFEKDVQKLFPNDRHLVKLAAQSYLAVPLSNLNGQVLGHLAVLDVKPFPLNPDDLSIFKIFGSRAGAELDRKQLEDASRRSDLTLRKIGEGTASVLGDEFFRSLVRNLAEALQVRHSFISEMIEGNRRVRTLAFWNGEEFLPNLEYDLAHTPCERVLEGEICLFPEKVQDKFPDHRRELAALNVESYLAIPMTGCDGRVLGHLAVMDTKPMREDPRVLSIFKIYGARAGAELERLRIEAALKISEQNLRDLFDEAPIAYVNEGLDTRFIRANRTAMRILGIKPEEVAGTYGRDFVPDTPEAKRRLQDALDSINRGTDTSGVVLELRRQDNGHPIWIQWWSRPDPSGAYTRTMFVDITDRVLMEREKARLEAQNSYLQEEIRSEHNFGEMIGNSPPLLNLLRQVDQVAPTDSTVLILGETGTGKELIARAIHDRSARRNHPLVKVNCGAISAGLVESELFGHVKGAFTGALAHRDGRFKLADRGTIFLDEVGELPLETQVKLLRVLQEQEFEAIGSSHSIKVDVRIIAATNRNLSEAVAQGKFRSDLYYRLNVFPVQTPALRERSGDIPLLVMFFVQRFSKRFGKHLKGVSEESMRRLVIYPWPGNIRELQNVIERAVVLSTGSLLEVAPDFAPHSGPGTPVVTSAAIAVTEVIPGSTPTAPDFSAAVPLEDVERRHIESILARTNWMIEGERGAAKILNLNPSTLRSRMQKLGIRRPARP
jgi:formate hydrogenlyase transcriptional activator